jgi:hypothetical protein
MSRTISLTRTNSINLSVSKCLSAIYQQNESYARLRVSRLNATIQLHSLLVAGPLANVSATEGDRHSCFTVSWTRDPETLV